jgi:hypothetical protein
VISLSSSGGAGSSPIHLTLGSFLLVRGEAERIKYIDNIEKAFIRLKGFGRRLSSLLRLVLVGRWLDLNEIDLPYFFL